MREVILPKVNADINQGKNFATLRQIYHSLILAAWFKKNFRGSFYKSYIDKNKTEGIGLKDKNVKEKVYGLYTDAFQKGMYLITKQESDPGTGKRIRRRYFSGGVWFSNGDKSISSALTVNTETKAFDRFAAGPEVAVKIKLVTGLNNSASPSAGTGMERRTFVTGLGALAGLFAVSRSKIAQAATAANKLGNLYPTLAEQTRNLHPMMIKEITALNFYSPQEAEDIFRMLREWQDTPGKSTLARWERELADAKRENADDPEKSLKLKSE